MSWVLWVAGAVLLAFGIRVIFKHLSPKENLKRHMQETYYEDPEDETKP